MTGFVLLILGIFFAVNLFFSSIIVILYPLFFDAPVDFMELIEQSILVIYILTSLFSLLLFWIVFLVMRKSWVRFSQFRKTQSNHLWYSVLMGLGFFMFFTGLLDLTGLPEHFPYYQEMMEMITRQPFLLSLLTIGVVAPFFEEIMCRGIILNRIRQDLPVAAAILLQALLFGIIHFNWLQGGYAFVGGIFMGLVFLWTGSLWVPVTIHLVWNISSVLVSHLGPAVDQFLLAAFLVVGILLLIPSIILFKNTRVASKEPPGSAMDQEPIV